ncbi:MAG: DUF6020 family protein [Bifidobacteriaceae bacterium]|nr:DUF6020 family protein [Bifidobacteriaceae bacterium]
MGAARRAWASGTIPVYAGMALFCAVVCLPLYRDGVISGGDSQFHLQRFGGTAAALQDGQFPPQVNPDALGGFGYAPNLFYGPLSAYLVLGLGKILGSWTAGINAFTWLAMFAAGALMCSFIRAASRSLGAGALAGLIYLAAPYHLVVTWVRAAYGEVLAFALVPLVFHGLWAIARRRPGGWWRLTVGAAGLILGHSLSALWTALFALVFMALEWRRWCAWRPWAVAAGATALALGLSAFFLLPLARLRATGLYGVFRSDSAFGELTDGVGQAALRSLRDLLFNASGVTQGGPAPFGTSTAIGWVILAGLVALPFGWRAAHARARALAWRLAALGLVAVVATTALVPWDHLPAVLRLIQYPWRLELQATFCLAAAGGIGLWCLARRLRRGRPWRRLTAGATCLVVGAGALAGAAGLINGAAHRDLLQPSQFFATDLTRAWPIALGEYLPTAAWRPGSDYSDLAERGREPAVVAGEATWAGYSEDGTATVFDVACAAGPCQVELPFIYYPGYAATLTTGEAQTDALQVSVSDGGLVLVTVPDQASGRVQTQFGRTATTTWGLAVSLIGLVVFLGLIARRAWPAGRRHLRRYRRRAGQRRAVQESAAAGGEAPQPKAPAWRLTGALAGGLVAALGWAIVPGPRLPGQTMAGYLKASLGGFGWTAVLAFVLVTALGVAALRVRQRRAIAGAAVIGAVFATAALLGRALAPSPHTLAPITATDAAQAKALVLWLGAAWTSYCALVVVAGWLVGTSQPAAKRSWAKPPWLTLSARRLGALYRAHPGRFMAVAWAAMVLLRLPYLVWLWPGIVTNDSSWQVAQAAGLVPLNNHHAVVHTLLLALFIRPAQALGSVSAGVGAFATCQLLVLCAACTYAVHRLLAWGANRWAAGAAYGFFALFPVYGLFGVSLWKDAAFATAGLALTVALIDLVRQPKAALTSPVRVAVGVLALAGVITLRANGPYVAAGAIVLVALAARPHRLRVGLSLGAVFLVVFGANQVVLRALHVEPSSAREMLAIPVQQLSYVAAQHGDDLTAEQRAFLEDAFGGSLWQLEDRPPQGDADAVQAVYDALAPATVEELGQAYRWYSADRAKYKLDTRWVEANAGLTARNWVDLGLEYPGTYLTGWLQLTNSYWYPVVTHNLVTTLNVQPSPGFQPGGYLIEQATGNLVARPAETGHPRLAQLVANPYYLPGVAVLYSTGFPFCVLLAASLMLWLRRAWRELAALGAIWLAWACSLIAPINGDYRYILAVALAAPLVVVLALSRGLKPAASAPDAPDSSDSPSAPASSQPAATSSG